MHVYSGRERFLVGAFSATVSSRRYADHINRRPGTRRRRDVVHSRRRIPRSFDCTDFRSVDRSMVGDGFSQHRASRRRGIAFAGWSGSRRRGRRFLNRSVDSRDFRSGIRYVVLDRLDDGDALKSVNVAERKGARPGRAFCCGTFRSAYWTISDLAGDCFSAGGHRRRPDGTALRR